MIKKNKKTCIYWFGDHCKLDEGLAQWNQSLKGKPISKECPPKCFKFQPKKKGSIIQYL